MAKTTPVYALPYPEETDRADVPADVQALALRIEAVLPNVGMPTGMGADWYAATAPSGFLLCDGSAVSRTTYAKLFAAIGTTWGAGDGSSTFNLPDTRGRVIIGLAAGGHADVATIAGNDGTALVSRRARHQHPASGLTAAHSLTLPQHIHGIVDPGHQTNMYGARTGGQNSGAYERISGSGLGDPVGVDDTIFTFGITQVTGITIANPTTYPAINGGVTVGGTVGPTAAPNDCPSYVVVAKVIKS